MFSERASFHGLVGKEVACPGRREGGLDHSFEEQCDRERFYCSLLFQREDFVVKL